MIRWMHDAASRCMSAGHEWLAADDPEACPDCIVWALAAAHRAGQEAMRERVAQWLLQRGDTVWADAIRALEVPHD